MATDQELIREHITALNKIIELQEELLNRQRRWETLSPQRDTFTVVSEKSPLQEHKSRKHGRRGITRYYRVRFYDEKDKVNIWFLARTQRGIDTYLRNRIGEARSKVQNKRADNLDKCIAYLINPIWPIETKERIPKNRKSKMVDLFDIEEIGKGKWQELSAQKRKERVSSVYCFRAKDKHAIQVQISSVDPAMEALRGKLTRTESAYHKAELTDPDDLTLITYVISKVGAHAKVSERLALFELL